MTFDKVLVTFLGLIGIVLTYWFFLMKKDKVVAASDTNQIDIIVDGGYSPDVISICRRAFFDCR